MGKGKRQDRIQAVRQLSGRAQAVEGSGYTQLRGQDKCSRRRVRG
jgi:hypothetical protein